VVSDSNQFSLLKERRFAPFFGTQFLGAFNDNVFRNGLIILITFQGVKVFGLNVSDLANVAAGLFMLPFFLFSATAGQIADKYEKSRLIQIYKTMEIGLMLLASVAFVTQSYLILFLLLFLMGCQSTFFGPVKYAYLPQHLATGELIGGNAMVESGTYVAIMLGLVVGGLSVVVDPDTLYVLVSFLIGIAVVGYFTSRAIPETKAVDPELRINWNLITESKRIIGFARVDRNVFLAILGISWFWFFGSAMTVQIPAYTLNILNGNEEITTLILVIFAFGVGAGSLLCERLSGQKVEIGLVPFGSIGLSVFAIDLYFAQSTLHPEVANTVSEFVRRPGSIRVIFNIAMIGAFGGLYSVPLYALVQQRSKRQQLSRIISATNILN
jgi:MFS family permease